MHKRAAVTIVGMGQGACLDLSARAMQAIACAQVLVGGRSQLAFFPDFEGEVIVLGKGIMATLDKVAQLAQEHDVCVLASGDPLFYGVANLVCRKVGAEHVEILPSLSSVQLAFARCKQSWNDAKVISVHGRSLVGLVSKMRGHTKVAVLTDPDHSPPRIATHLLDYGQGDRGYKAYVCANLGGAGESIQSYENLTDLAQSTPPEGPNVLVLLCDRPEPVPVLAALSEDEFAKKMPKRGLITKREVRVMALGLMGITSESVVWDIGTGSGSVAIEAGRLASHGRVFALDVEDVAVAYCMDNARRLGADNVQAIHARAPAGLDELPDPDAVFVGGTKGGMEAIVQTVWERLRPQGKMVVSAVTLENVHQAYTCLKALGQTPELTLVQVSRGKPLAHYLRYEAHNPIHLFSLQKPGPKVSV